MKKKVNLFLMLICISVIFYTNIFAITKKDILNYVDSQTVCGDVGLFNSYKTTFSRLLKQKKLSQTELNTIYSYLQNSVGILNGKGVCKIADLSKLTSQEKNTVYNSLKSGANIITSAPMLQFGESEDNNSANDNTNNNTAVDNNTNLNTNKDTNQNTNINSTEGTKVTINTQDNTMDIYENGVLVDKVSMSTSKMTYTGINITHVIIVIVCVVLFVGLLVCYKIFFKQHSAKNRFVKNILMSLMICSVILATGVGVFSNKIDSLLGIIDLISFKGNTEEIKVELNEDNSIKKYPSYGSNYAVLRIDKLDIENKVYFGDTTSILSLGIGHSSSSDMPTEGGTIVYSGHNREDMLNNLKNIKQGYEITVDTSYAICTYEVKKTEILKDTQTDKLTKLNDKETLILYTCYPFDSYIYTNQRFVVYSELKSVEWK